MAKDYDAKPVTVYIVDKDGTQREVTQVNEFTLPAVYAMVMRGTTKEVRLRRTGKYKGVSQRDKIQVVQE